MYSLQLLSYILGFICWAGGFLYLLENQGDPFHDYENARDKGSFRFGDVIWFLIITASTVGYGDYFPVTDLGKIFGVFYLGSRFLNCFFPTKHHLSFSCGRGIRQLHPRNCGAPWKSAKVCWKICGKSLRQIKIVMIMRIVKLFGQLYTICKAEFSPKQEKQTFLAASTWVCIVLQPSGKSQS